MPEKLIKDVLNNVGLFVVSLMKGEKVVTDINFVTQVSRGSDDKIIRTILSPV